MMAHQPAQIGDRSKFIGSLGIGLPSPRGGSSPRWHFAGEVPPDLSPLDAFAAQSRLLARQLEESAHGEKRISRLPPLTVANSLNPVRPGYFRSTSPDPSTANASPGYRKHVEEEETSVRPTSIHPSVLSFNEEEKVTSRNDDNSLGPIKGDQTKDQRLQSPADGYPRVQRDRSPLKSSNSHRSFKRDQAPPSAGSLVRQRRHSPPGNESQAVSDRKVLAHSRSPMIHRSSSQETLAAESSEDEKGMRSRRRVLHNVKDSGHSQSVNNISTTHDSLQRTSSMSSDASFCATRLVTSPQFNFSRPLSRTSVNPSSHDLPSQNASLDTSSVLSTDDIKHTSINFQSTEINGTPTYVYSKFSLPRGKMVQRNSVIFLESPSINPHSPDINNYYTSAPSPLPSSPSIRGLGSSLRPDDQPGCEITLPPLDLPRPSTNSSSSSRLSPEPGRVSPLRSLSKGEGSNLSQRPTTSSDDTASTIKPRSIGSSVEFSAAEHIEKAIEYHNAGTLNKSTYHLRLAARMSHPTGMLLYALACRHGWGMRPSPREGVAWLRKAVEQAGVVVADDENMMQAGKEVDVTEIKAKKAQFALGIYELGVSHMNGWGIERDKALALRCFEIAGAWGDADAMSEAGFCYAQGIGCKKDLKKSAKFYRMAEAKGVNMIGNSWIYKAKYNDDDSANEDTDGRGRSNTASSKSTTASSDKRHKSRTRGIFGRSKASS